MRVETGTDLLLADIDDGVATMTFNDPARHNVLSSAMHQAMVPLVEAWEVDDRVRVVVMRGAGDRAFAAGADIGEFKTRGPNGEAPDHAQRPASNGYACWGAMSKPIIAAINGYCIGGGLLMALQADIRICSDRSTFAVPAAKVGLGYGTFGVRSITRVAGPAAAADLLFSARRISAQEALHAGLVNRCVPVEGFDAVIAEAAAEIARNAPLTIRACKAAIRYETERVDESDSPLVEQLVAAASNSLDFREGQLAFKQKRQPVFRGI